MKPENTAGPDLRPGVCVRELRESDLDQIALIHADCFPEAVLTRLGHETVRRYYEWQFRSAKYRCFVGADIDGELRGFCFAGCFHRAFSGFVNVNRTFLLSRLVLTPSLWMDAKVLSAVTERLVGNWHQMTSRVGDPRRIDVVNRFAREKAFGVLAIGVAGKSRSHGIGRILMEEAERNARARLFTMMNLTVHPENLAALRFYEALKWRRDNHQVPWNGRMVKRLD